MGAILFQAVGLFMIILLGYFLKRKGLFKKEDGTILSRIIMTITLPAAIMVGLQNVHVTTEFIFLMVTAMMMNTVLLIIASYLWRDHSTLERSFFMFSITGYNVGNFTLPFIQGFLPQAVPYLFMFDVGNSIMLGGITMLLVQKFGLRKDAAFRIENLTRTLLSSVPFVTYLMMLSLRVMNKQLPFAIMPTIELVAKANGFLSLFMIGLYLELSLPDKAHALIIKILGWRYLFSAMLATLFFFVIPIQNQLVRVVLTVLSFAPIPTFSVVNSVKIGIDEESTGFISSASILISLICMTLIMLLIAT